MFVTLRMSASAARQLSLPVDDGQVDVTVTLTSLELAGRLTVSTGKVFTPEAVIRYCRAWSAARAACRSLVARYGLAAVVEMVRTACAERFLWLPEDDREIVPWLHLVLEIHVISATPRSNLTAAAAYAWAYQLTRRRLAELCEANFAIAYNWWHRSEIASALLPRGFESVTETDGDNELS